MFIATLMDGNVKIADYDVGRFFHWKGSGEEVAKLGTRGCRSIPSDDMIFYYVPVVVVADEKKLLSVIIGCPNSKPHRCGSSVTSVLNIFLKGVAMVGTMSTEIGSSSPESEQPPPSCSVGAWNQMMNSRCPHSSVV